jgi:hypothetical protein
MQTFTSQELYEFIDRAGKATWAGDGEKITPEREGFDELEYSEGDFYYRDSFTGYTKSRGTELVRYKGQTVWAASYGGGMVDGKEDIQNECFTFLKKAMSADEDGFQSFRGPHSYKDGDWEYSYIQDGDINEFSGSEEIKYKGELVFYHKMIGGIINHSNA